ncbi:hypothetical protein BESB_022220 [Besnoitia besnoiti]|uniref:Splicing factor YJU2 n=1 Tax=Besnoitia besnoiti TaxID=94643 RepID=A0A2A9M8L4_BESBE|nr:hypothetical protein BESB_022220 [Besnoitia besnoiti]PFH31730.1 hypothetical protein BESB_022220 [Besnoitia besnoiti]
MADRKVLVKYYPPDFDFDVLRQKKRVLYKAKELQHGKKPRQSGMSKIMNVRMMFPFTLQCASCREFVYVGTKFNSRVERVQGEDYLGIVKWRFYGRCPNCRGEICFKTDPKNGDYVLEWGGTRTYDPMRDQQLAEERVRKEREQELEGDRMKQVEAKTYNVQSELAAMEQLEELRKMNRRLVDREAATEQALQFLRQNEVPHEEADEWDDQERTELMKFMQTQRELREQEEDSNEDDDEDSAKPPRRSWTSSVQADEATRTSCPSRTRPSASSYASFSASSFSSQASSPARSEAASSARSAGSAERRGDSAESARGCAVETGRSASPSLESHAGASRKDRAAAKAPGSSAAPRSMFMLTAVSDKSPRLLVKKKKEEGDSFADLLGSYASSSSDEEKQADKEASPDGGSGADEAKTSPDCEPRGSE